MGNLPEQREPADNHSPDKAAPIAPGTVVNGVAEATNNDYFKLSLKKDEQVVLDCWADRIDSRLDGTLVIYDTAGRELATDRDTNRRDPLLAFTAPADGDYIVKLYDAVYRGGNDYFYRLLVTAGPYVDFVFPPVALPGAKSGFTLFGSHLPGGVKAEGQLSRGRTLEQLAVEIEAPGGPAADDLELASLAGPRMQRSMASPIGSLRPPAKQILS